MTLILLYLLPSTHEKKEQVNRFIVMQRVVVFFKNGARTNIVFLKAAASICKNSLLVTTGAIFWWQIMSVKITWVFPFLQEKGIYVKNRILKD